MDKTKQDNAPPEQPQKPKSGLVYRLPDLNIEGTAVIRDKHGNVKAELKLSSDIED
jgi:hypothetical protein